MGQGGERGERQARDLSGAIAAPIWPPAWRGLVDSQGERCRPVLRRWAPRWGGSVGTRPAAPRSRRQCRAAAHGPLDFHEAAGLKVLHGCFDEDRKVSVELPVFIHL